MSHASRSAEKDPADTILDRLHAEEPLPPAPAGAGLPELAPGDGRTGSPRRDGADASLEAAVLENVRLRVRIVLGRRKLRLEEAVRLSAGDVVELGRKADGSVEVFAGTVPVARGEVVVVQGRLCVRITELIEEESRRDA